MTTSFWSLLQQRPIHIPLLQRDYAQGRPDPATTDIRTGFVKALYGALIKPEPLSLDFVYGTTAGDSASGDAHSPLTPLDGQQRLTTLFLLHWFVSAKAKHATKTEETVKRIYEVAMTLHRFTYENRISARNFCARLAKTEMPRSAEGKKVAEWLADQSWFQASWHRDVTVRGMLVMLAEIEEQFGQADAEVLFTRLFDATACPVTFQYLPLTDYSLSDDLYVRMNARGKPLSPFENWKARFDELLTQAEGYGATQARAFAEKLDGDWTAFFWRNVDPQQKNTVADPAVLVDEPFRQFLDFVTRMLWLRDRPEKHKITPEEAAGAVPFAWYEEVYGESQEEGSDKKKARPENLECLQQVLNTLASLPDQMAAFFPTLLGADEPVGAADRPVRLLTGWGDLPDPKRLNLFRTCCQVGNQSADWWRDRIVDQALFFTTLLYAAERRVLTSADQVLRDLLRVVRNRILAVRWPGRESYSLDSERIRREQAQLLREITELVKKAIKERDAYAALSSLSSAAFAHEQEKAPYVRTGSEWRARLLRIEDSLHFRGALHLLGLGQSPNPEALDRKLLVIKALWLNPEAVQHEQFTGLVVRALAATPGGAFVANDRGYLFFGGQDNGWNRILSEDSKERRNAFQIFADTYAEGKGDWQDRLQYVIDRHLEARKTDALTKKDWSFQWPYYIARYAGMTCQNDDYTRCLYKWWNFQYGDSQYQSCAMLSKNTLGGDNFHPFAKAAAVEWKKQVDKGHIKSFGIELDTPHENGSDEIPLYVYRMGADGKKETLIKLFYGHVKPIGWRLPYDYKLSPVLKQQFKLEELKLPSSTKPHQWLFGLKSEGEESKLDDIEVVIRFVQKLAK